jgi:isopentenyl-diphosphate delta-isomerase
MQETVILVDTNDKQIGTAEKLQAHKDAQLHRAFSIFIFNKHGDMLLQQRALTKYHCGGLWANAVCGHPRPNETLEAATKRRMREEIGITCPLREQLHYTYKVPFENGLTEHEFLHVFVGTCDESPVPNPAEVAQVEWLSIDKIKEELKTTPKKYAFWFHESMKRLFP